MINVFVPHRWNTDDYEKISALLDRTKYNVKNYSVPSDKPLEKIDKRYNVDPQIATKIKYSSVIVCSNRPALSGGMAIDEIKYAHSIDKPIVAVKLLESNNSELVNLGVEIIPNRKDSLENWIDSHVK